MSAFGGVSGSGAPGAEDADILGFGRTPPHDYEGLPPTRRMSPMSRRAVGAVTAAAALVVGFLLSAGMSAGREEAVAQNERKDELIALILERQDHADELAEELDDLRATVDAAQEEVASRVPALQEEIEQVELAAGLVDLRGPGLHVTLRDSPTCPPAAYQCRIQDGDLQQAVNTLFAAGAEAVSVGGERVVSTTAIRGAGFTILANLTVLSDPYEIKAIGDPARLREQFETSEFGRVFAGFVEEYGLGLEIEEGDELEIPRFGGTVAMDAQPAAGASAIEE